MSKKLFILRDNTISHTKFDSWIQTDSELEIVGEADNIKNLHLKLKDIVPDAIIIDLEKIDLDKSLYLLKKMEKYNIKNIIAFSYQSDHIFILNKIKSEVKAYTSQRECRTIFLKALKNI